MTHEKGLDVFEAWIKARDRGIETWAKAALQVTSSNPYARIAGTMAQPGLIVAAWFRKTTERTMSQLLAQLNMPSRGEVLSLSQRLTHIEMLLDDLGAALDAGRAVPVQAAAPPPARGTQPLGERPRPRAAGEG